MWMNRCVPAELDGDGCATGIDFEQIQWLTQDTQAMTVSQCLRGDRNEAKAIHQLFLQLIKLILSLAIRQPFVNHQSFMHIGAIGIR